MVTGTVIFKEDNSTAPGVNVVEKGTKNGTQTKSDGTFELTVNDPKAVLVFSFIGVRTQELELNGKKEVFVKLKLDCNKDFLTHITLLYMQTVVSFTIRLVDNLKFHHPIHSLAS